MRVCNDIDYSSGTNSNAFAEPGIHNICNMKAVRLSLLCAVSLYSAGNISGTHFY